MACRALLLLLVFTASALRAVIGRALLSDASNTLSGTAVVIAVDRKGQQPSHMLRVHTSAGTQVTVTVANQAQLHGVHTGMQIEVTGRWQQRKQQKQKQSGGVVAAAAVAGTGASFAAATIRASGARAAAPVVATTKASGVATAAARVVRTASVLSTNELVSSDVSTLIIPIAGMADASTACPYTALPLFTAEQVKGAVFQEANPNGTTVGSTFSRCSYGKTRLTTANSMVADRVDLPCNGTTNGVAWTFNSCNWDDFNGYADAADEALAARGIDLSQYKHKVYLLPPNTCAFVGLAYVGCDGSFDCRVWMSGSFWATPQAISHELMHNLYLAHAGATTAAGTIDQYADTTCTMGYCCGDRCPNTPHAWQLGWISVQQLDGTSLKPGQTIKTTLLSQSTSSRSGLRIVPTWAPSAEPLFVGYRTRKGGDAAALPTTTGRVHMYSANITSTYDPTTTRWLSSLAKPGKAWAYRAAGLVVRLTSLTSAGATVSVCRKGGPETLASCQAGVDRDCNGLAGPQDPVCVRILAAATPAVPPQASRS